MMPLAGLAGKGVSVAHRIVANQGRRGKGLRVPQGLAYLGRLGMSRQARADLVEAWWSWQAWTGL